MKNISISRLFVLFFLLTCPSHSQPGDLPNQQYSGFIGEGEKEFAQKFGFRYYGLYGVQNDPGNPTSVHSLNEANDPPPGKNVIRKVAQLNHRQDGLGYTAVQFQESLKAFAQRRASWYANPFWWWSAPQYSWWSPDPGNLLKNERREIRNTINRDRLRGSRSNIWEIGNEPNLFPFMEPAAYARIFELYYREIKAMDPDARIALGSFFMPELIPDDARDYIGHLIMIKGSEEYDKAVDSWWNKQKEYAGAAAWTGTLGLARWASLGLEKWGAYAAERAARDVKNMLMRKLFGRSSAQYFQEVLNALPPDITPDLISVHPYMGDFKKRYPASNLLDIMERSIGEMRNHAASKRTYPRYCDDGSCRQGGPGFFVTEFGNINPSMGEFDMADRMHQILHRFQSLGMQGWLWYKPVGNDKQFEMFQGTVGGFPLTQLVRPGFQWDAARTIECADFNYLGQTYWGIINAWAPCQ